MLYSDVKGKLSEANKKNMPVGDAAGVLSLNTEHWSTLAWEEMGALMSLNT